MRLIKILICWSVSIPILTASPTLQALSDEIYRELEVFSRIIEVVDKEYVADIDEQELIEGAIRGMLSSLDPHSMYLTPELYKTFRSDTTGKFGGIGIEVTVQKGILTIVSPIEDTPAAEAGLKSGDRIIKIDGEPTRDITLFSAVQRMRGNRGKKITLTIWRDGMKAPHDYVITRQVIKVKSVKGEILPGGISYVRITSFQDNTTDDLKKKLKALEQENGGTLNGIILDLRDNPGGLLNESVEVADLFLSEGVIVSTKGRHRKPEYSRARSGNRFEKVPMVVLINRGSASASEIVAGALQDNRRAVILGSRSFGKGSVQTLMDLGNNAALKLTIAHYLTPKGRFIDGLGIAPDLVYDEAEWEKAYPNKAQDERPPLREYQKDVAHQYLLKQR